MNHSDATTQTLFASASVPELHIQIAGPRRDDVGEHATRAQTEQGNRDRQKGEVVVKDDRKNAGERQLQNQRGERREAEPEIELRPTYIVS